MRIKEKRMKSFAIRANVLLLDKKHTEAAKAVSDGLQYYSHNVIKAIYPYAAADAGMIVVVLRHLADEMESKNVGAKEFAEWLDKHTKESPLTEMQIEKIRTCETVMSTEEKGCAIRNSQWADRIRERFMKKE